MPRLTKRLLDSLAPREKLWIAWDDELRGFGVRVSPYGAKTFFIQYRTRSRREEKVTLGRYGVLTVDQARDMARDGLVKARQGGSLAEDVRQARQVRGETFGGFSERYYDVHVVPHTRPRWAHECRRILDKYLLPAFGRKALVDVSAADVVRLHHKMRESPIMANRCVAVLSSIFHQAENWGVRPRGSNPTLGITKYKEHKRERYLDGDELARLGDTLRECERDYSEPEPVIALIRLLILTGCRLSEIQTARWENVDLDAGTLRLVESKTGARTIHLAPVAVEVLRRIEREPGQPHVIAGVREGAHFVGVPRAWRRIRVRAGLPDLRIHDLRHSYASIGVSGGLSLPMVGKLLGHTVPGTTQRYAHLSADPVREAGKRIANEIARQMGDKPEPDNVIDIAKKDRR